MAGLPATAPWLNPCCGLASLAPWTKKQALHVKRASSPSQIRNMRPDDPRGANRTGTFYSQHIQRGRGSPFALEFGLVKGAVASRLKVACPRRRTSENGLYWLISEIIGAIKRRSSIQPVRYIWSSGP